MTRERMSEQELDATLADLGERLAYPHPTRLADVVSARLREPRAGDRNARCESVTALGPRCADDAGRGSRSRGLPGAGTERCAPGYAR